jgi:uncharacterized protein DUF4440
MSGRVARVLVAAGFIAAVGSYSLVRAQSNANADIAAVMALENGFVKADLANDKAFNATFGFSTGVRYTKAGLLNMMDPKETKTNHEELSDLKVRLYGTTAIATYKEKWDGVEHGKPASRTIIVTDTFVKINGEWKAVAGHSSEVKPQGK